MCIQHNVHPESICLPPDPTDLKTSTRPAQSQSLRSDFLKRDNFWSIPPNCPKCANQNASLMIWPIRDISLDELHSETQYPKCNKIGRAHV